MAAPPVEHLLPRRQSHYLYMNNWVPDDDRVLLEYLISKKENAEELGETFNYDNCPFILEAHHNLVEFFSRWKEPEEVHARIEFLKKRYNTFTYVVNHEGVQWKRREEYVKAKEAVWRRMIAENDFVIAYCVRDEPEYTDLTRVFAPDSANDDDMGEVVAP